MSWWERFFRLDLSFAATGLIWNSMMSMAGGWFFLTVSEAFVLGEHDFRLPGLGSYMSLAIERGDGRAQFLGVLAMLVMIVFVDQLVWRPVVAWSQKFTDEERGSTSGSWLWERISSVAFLADCLPGSAGLLWQVPHSRRLAAPRNPRRRGGAVTARRGVGRRNNFIGAIAWELVRGRAILQSAQHLALGGMALLL